jgi:hypothetical protein
MDTGQLEHMVGPYSTMRAAPREQGVTIQEMAYKWKFLDTTLVHKLDVTLTESVDFRTGQAITHADVIYDSGKLDYATVSDYVRMQLMQIAIDGKAFP